MIHSLAKHIIVEFYSCNRTIISDLEIIKKQAEEALSFEGVSIESSYFRSVEAGVTGTVLTPEIRISICTWPTHGYAAVDIFTSSATIDPWLSYDFLKGSLQAVHDSATELRRGQIRTGSGGMPQKPLL
ncbi:adenosylmethionine decarboxylase [Desulfurispira natronophila]|uniref:S-adenosylmethionine decarboxylase proenzyme n=1 Tax=Desulfurispira natronophila TaxID=682562 RepID=A0A7W7Y3I9_9BACT|nr:adenosylmethionine decarboxylase [Desulfurispira natronophila]MBB5021418.1 S-adenosylmethionine decarboxylase proenzyme [Desulfurispira natronophila]